MTTAKQLYPRSAFVGFDKLFDELDRVARNASDTYPPTNILKASATDYIIELAVAGFAEEDLQITVEDRTLTVKGERVEDARDYVHKGISTKKFQRKFRVSEFVEVVGAEIKNGILAIHLEVIVPESQRPRFIEIGSVKSKKQLLNEENNNA